MSAQGVSRGHSRSTGPFSYLSESSDERAPRRTGVRITYLPPAKRFIRAKGFSQRIGTASKPTFAITDVAVKHLISQCRALAVAAEAAGDLQMASDFAGKLLGADFVEAVVISATYTYLCLLAAADDDSQPCYRPARGQWARSSTARL